MMGSVTLSTFHMVIIIAADRWLLGSKLDKANLFSLEVAFPTPFTVVSTKSPPVDMSLCLDLL